MSERDKTLGERVRESDLSARHAMEQSRLSRDRSRQVRKTLRDRERGARAARPIMSLVASGGHPRALRLCMIVEDDALVAMALEDELIAAGYDVSGPFATCAEARASLDDAKPDMAVLDTVLKDGSSLDLARELRRIEVPFVIHSSRGKGHRDAPELVGAPWVMKPAPYSEVVNCVGLLLR